nr:unnamed protein product [Callosobruchus analis]
MKLHLQLIWLFVLFYIASSQRRICPANFCDTIRVSCLQVECNGERVKQIKPELCRCCPNCYTENASNDSSRYTNVITDEGGDCSDPWETTCATGLKCNVRGICVKPDLSKDRALKLLWKCEEKISWYFPKFKEMFFVGRAKEKIKRDMFLFIIELPI